MLLVGSRCAKLLYPEFRQPKDYDFIATTQEVDQFLSQYSYQDTSTHHKKKRAKINLNGRPVSFEFELIEHYPSSKLIYEKNKVSLHKDKVLNTKYHIATPQTLFLLKKSHIIFPIHWQKNIHDYHFLKNKCASLYIPSWWDNALKLRYKEVETRIQKKHMNFDVDNSEFFRKSAKSVKRVVEHDSLHYATCFFDQPLFLSAKEDLSKAALSKDKVKQMSLDHKIKLIQEEAIVLSLERHIIKNMITNKSTAYNGNEVQFVYYQTVGKMVCHYLPIWMRYFAADHFQEIMHLDFDFVKKCLDNHPTLRNIILSGGQPLSALPG